MNICACKKRLKALIIEERKLEHKENMITRKLFIYNSLLNQLHTCAIEQWQKLHILLEQVEKLQRRNAEITDYVDENNEDLQEQQMQLQKLHQCCIELKQKKQNFLKEMHKLYSLKAVSNVTIDFDKLPARIQGLTLCEKEDSSEWQAIDIDPLQSTQQQVQEFIWQKVHNGSVYREQWDKLFFQSNI